VNVVRAVYSYIQELIIPTKKEKTIKYANIMITF